MNKIQLSIIEGSLLGDGCFSRLKAHPTWNWKFQKNQSKLDDKGYDKLSYLSYHNNQLSSFIGGGIYPFTHKPSRIANNKTITPQTHGYCYRTRTHPFFTELGKKWYRISEDNKLIKILPPNLELTPLSLCIWLMDDGSKEVGHNRYKIATNCFTEQEVEQLITLLKVKHDIKCTKNKHYSNFVLSISGYTNCKRFYDLITPCVAWSCFQYKLEPLKPVIVLCGEKHPASKLTKANIEDMVKMHEAGDNQETIAKRFAIKRNTISAIFHQKSWRHNSIKIDSSTLGHKGENNPRAILSKMDVINIKQQYGEKSYGQLAKQFNVSRSTIAAIIKGRSWRS